MRVHRSPASCCCCAHHFRSCHAYSQTSPGRRSSYVVPEVARLSTPAMESGSAGGPTVLRMLLGAHLRRLREAQGVSREDAGWEIRSSESKISRMELGRVGFKERDIEDLLTLYGVDDPEERARLMTLAREGNNPGWWHRFGDVLPG